MSLGNFLKKPKTKTTIMYSHPELKQRIVIDITDNYGYIVTSEGKVFSCANENDLLSFLREQLFMKLKKEGEINVSVNL